MSVCRSCGSDLDQTFVDLGNQPLSNGYLASPNSPDPTYPLHAWVCGKCLLVQADEVIPPDGIFVPDYAFVSGASAPWVNHCTRYAKQMVRRFDPATVLEVASNDGTLLHQFPDTVNASGVDPTGDQADISEFFTEKLATELDTYDLVVANNVLGHVPDLNDFIAGLRMVLAPEGVLTVEVPWLWNILNQCQYDTIYHEHFSYFSVTALETAFARHDLTVFDVESLAVHGGSLRFYIGHAHGPYNETDGVRRVRTTEHVYGVDRPTCVLYRQFSDRVACHSANVRQFFEQAAADGTTVVGAGAPAKGNTLLNTAGITSDLMAVTTDTTTAKQGSYLPGSHIPVVAPELIDELEPDYLFVLAWNWFPSIVDSLAHARDWGGRFVKPVPHVEVYP